MKISRILSRIVTILAFLTFSVPTYGAEDLSRFCSVGNTTEIYYVNGVGNDFKQAAASLALVEKSYKHSLEIQYPNQKFEFKVSYNYSAGVVRDTVEVIGQKMNEIDDPEVNKYTASQYLHLYQMVSNFDEEIPLLAEPIKIVIEEYLAGRVTDVINSDTHIQKYRSSLLAGIRVLLIAHSQGNLFANQAIAALMGEYGTNIGMIGVASPAEVTYNNTPYFTADDDRIINALRLVQNVLPANVDNDPGFFGDFRDSPNHGFAPSYMDPTLVSRGLIDEQVYLFMASYQFPIAEVEDGIITATLEWDEQPDVDLHSFEPNGIQVYYANKTGVSGYLDLDDTDGFGPEHYYVGCDTLENGTYSFAVNYFNGSAPTVARVQVEAGGLTRSFTVPLDTAVGSAGNSTPFSVVDVIVGGDSINGFDFLIEGR